MPFLQLLHGPIMLRQLRAWRVSVGAFVPGVVSETAAGCVLMWAAFCCHEALRLTLGWPATGIGSIQPNAVAPACAAAGESLSHGIYFATPGFLSAASAASAAPGLLGAAAACWTLSPGLHAVDPSDLLPRSAAALARRACAGGGIQSLS